MYIKYNEIFLQKKSYKVKLICTFIIRTLLQTILIFHLPYCSVEKKCNPFSIIPCIYYVYEACYFSFRLTLHGTIYYILLL